MGNNASWMEVLPHDVVSAYIDVVNNLSLVSVGSGLGHFESIYEKKSGRVITCVDPAPYSWNTGAPSRLPDYPTVDDLLKAKPELKSNCTLLLFWASPNNSTYDVDAILKLDPQNIVIVYESIGAAGSQYLHAWLQSIGAPNGNSIGKSIVYDEIPHVYHFLSSYEMGTRGFTDNTKCVALISKDKNLDVRDVPTRDYDQAPPRVQRQNRDIDYKFSM